MVTPFSWIRRHKVLFVIGIFLLLSIVWMAVTGTLSYPYIMVDRQVQSIRYCLFGNPSFETHEYGFRFTVPNDLCILPHRTFPLDGSIQVLPKGFYFVVNEYAKGSVIEASKGAYLFERARDGRTIPVVMDSLKNGGFLTGATTDVVKNSHGVTLTVVRHASGIDPSMHFNWAFAMNRKNDVLLSILTKDIGGSSSFEALIDGVELFP